MNAIITATELASELERPTAPVLLDVRYQMGGPPGRPVYEAGHVPGAVYVDLESELASPPGPGGRHPLPDLDVFTEAMRAAGVRADHPVVVYDGGQGWAAARAWWLLRWTGHPDVRVLDGGLAAWEAAGGALSVDQSTPQEGDFTPVPGGLALLRADDAAALARRGVLLDARAAERYRGEVEPIDKVAGHIPGAVSAPTTENVVEGGTVFRDASELAERFASLGATPKAEVGVYCGSGVSAAHEVLALAVAGVPAALYVGSWSEWSADPSRPVATGPQPG
ncbi:thiosulfate/3-mercaptopyruvate sulfurtransferase [Streptomyces sp. 2224.1]|uniref:sulfurtransferase n=1 Tax=unclassified Streptomyces TaxID=2593676 RepID=UPI000890C989|nr:MULTISPECIES: sulfurtransferase [unclassified Streptomyces]PBC85523.1 thiosulfate/3-mercaptopyruvate sulfurtransferase [Streptomyces sp. 2321.6]SDR12932.1 thiosulfate/3-mercaptopyruvate sulfurtransferase [Streptomyces sp. KS_16]SED70736.1 thiosulfate/3-mercaptopyruvate sulfurtransferase [Streptomyces sp. 2133.1]SEE34741.1 thiosulfate/3-mercaptopyruvate sulfurtransferase [Streptomyces sp. 2224.1]SNC72005.1 thiosulfate/3-mercaptopyruvate sulfurtransferase [Streptomyces sp. 2114.4]